jgi:hypothetical protein
MSFEEMHAMEKAALEDPFLADAMEGSDVVTPTGMAQDLDQLKSRLDQRIGPRATVSMQPKQWLSMAAAIVIVLGAAIASWYIFQPKAEQQIAQTTETKLKEPGAVIADTPAAAPIDSAVVATLDARKPNVGASKTVTPKINTTSTPILDSVAQDMAIVKEETKSAQKVEATVDRLSRSASEDAATYKQLSKAAPSQAPSLANVKKDSASSARIFAEPADGWAAFEVYMRTGLRKPVSPVLHGNVVVNFYVDPDNGRLFDFHIEKSLHPLYDKEAIRVLKEGPAWSVYNSELVIKTSYTVVF